MLMSSSSSYTGRHVFSHLTLMKCRLFYRPSGPKLSVLQDPAFYMTADEPQKANNPVTYLKAAEPTM